MSRARAVPVLSEEDRTRLGLTASAPSDPIGPWRTLRSRLLAWGYRHRTSVLLLAPLLLVTLAMRLWGLDHGPALADDEGTYLAQAWSVQHQHALAPYTYWYDHPPFGWIQLAAWTSLTGAFGRGTLAILSGRELMALYGLLDAGLLYVLARRLGVRRVFGAAAVAAFALSPLAVGMGRMVYLDNIALPWLLLAFVLAASPRRDLWAFVASGVCFAAAVLSKETVGIVLPALVLLLWQRTVRQTRTFCLTGFAAGFLLVASAYPLLALLKGELLPGAGHVSLVDALRFQFLTRPSTGSLLAPGTASREVFTGWVSLDGLLLLGGLVALVPVLLVRRYRALAVALGLLVLAGIRPGYLPQPFVLAVLPFAALVLAAGADVAWTWARRPRARRTPSWLAPAAVGGVFLVLAAFAVPTWVSGDRALAAADHVTPTKAAARWLEQHPQPGRLLVDDTVWADLVSHGYRPADVVWFYKLDFVNNLDPSVRERIHGWSDFHVVLLTPVVRQALRGNDGSFLLVRQAVAHARPVASFGRGHDRVEVLVVQPPAHAPGTRTR